MRLRGQQISRPILGSRLKTVHSFGMVILEIEKMSFCDAGTYSCQAKNAFGEAIASVVLGCVDKEMPEQVPKFTTHLVVSQNCILGYNLNGYVFIYIYFH